MTPDIEDLRPFGKWGDTLDDVEASPPTRLEFIRRTWGDRRPELWPTRQAGHAPGL